MTIQTYSKSKSGNLQISKHFRLIEHACSTSDVVLLDSELYPKIEQLMVRIGATVGIISSGYRTPTESIRVGGYATDPHTKGIATDIKFQDAQGKIIPSEIVCCVAQDLGFGGIAYITSSYTHLDVRTGSTYRGDERKTPSSIVGKDFYSYFGIPRQSLQRNLIQYSTHVQNIGWQDYVSDGAIAGTTGQSLRVEALKIKLNNIVGNITYQGHVQDIGWMSEVEIDNICGTVGQSLRLEAIKIYLSGEVTNQYDIYYKCHIQDIGWMPWVQNGELAGTQGESRRLEAIRIVLVPKGEQPPQ